MELAERCSSAMSQKWVLAGCGSFHVSLKYAWESATSESGLMLGF
jgi:hypothetical protein